MTDALCAREGCGQTVALHRKSAAGNLYCWSMEVFWIEMKAAFNYGRRFLLLSTDAFLAVPEDAGTPPDHCPECGCSKWNGIGLQDKNVHFPHCSRVSPLSDSGAPRPSPDLREMGRCGKCLTQPCTTECRQASRAETPPAPLNRETRDSLMLGAGIDITSPNARVRGMASELVRYERTVREVESQLASLSSLQAETQRRLALALMELGRAPDPRTSALEAIDVRDVRMGEFRSTPRDLTADEIAAAVSLPSTDPRP